MTVNVYFLWILFTRKRSLCAHAHKYNARKWLPLHTYGRTSEGVLDPATKQFQRKSHKFLTFVARWIHDIDFMQDEQTLQRWDGLDADRPTRDGGTDDTTTCGNPRCACHRVLCMPPCVTHCARKKWVHVTLSFIWPYVPAVAQSAQSAYLA